MDIENIDRLAYELMKDRKAQPNREKGYIYYHGKRVSNLSLHLRKSLLPGDYSYDDYLIVASIFHDIGKGFTPHEKYGALLVKDILRNFCSKNDIERIADLISYHQGPRKDNSLSDYIRIIQDADILDRYGSMQLWLRFYDSASYDKPIGYILDYYDNEFLTQAEEMRNLLNYDLSQMIFDEKVKYLLSFVDRFKIESCGGVYNG